MIVYLVCMLELAEMVPVPSAVFSSMGKAQDYAETRWPTDNEDDYTYGIISYVVDDRTVND